MVHYMRIIYIWEYPGCNICIHHYMGVIWEYHDIINTDMMFARYIYIVHDIPLPSLIAGGYVVRLWMGWVMMSPKVSKASRSWTGCEGDFRSGSPSQHNMSWNSLSPKGNPHVQLKNETSMISSSSMYMSLESWSHKCFCSQYFSSVSVRSTSDWCFWGAVLNASENTRRTACKSPFGRRWSGGTKVGQLSSEGGWFETTPLST